MAPWSSKELQPLTLDLNISASEEFLLTKIIRLQTKMGVCCVFCIWTIQLQQSPEVSLRRAKTSLVLTCDRKWFRFWFSDEEENKQTNKTQQQQQQNPNKTRNSQRKLTFSSKIFHQNVSEQLCHVKMIYFYCKFLQQSVFLLCKLAIEINMNI